MKTLSLSNSRFSAFPAAAHVRNGLLTGLSAWAGDLLACGLSHGTLLHPRPERADPMTAAISLRVLMLGVTLAFITAIVVGAL